MSHAVSPLADLTIGKLILERSISQNNATLFKYLAFTWTLNLISKSYIANRTPFSFYISVWIDTASKILFQVSKISKRSIFEAGYCFWDTSLESATSPFLWSFLKAKRQRLNIPQKAPAGQTSSSNGDRMTRMECLKQPFLFVRLVASSKADTRHNGQHPTNPEEKQGVVQLEAWKGSFCYHSRKEITHNYNLIYSVSNTLVLTFRNLH